MAGGAPGFAVHEAAIADTRDAALIDDFVRATPGATPFHLTGWSRAVAKGCRQHSHYLIAQDGAGSIAGVLPLTQVRSPLFGRALVSSGFAVGGGVLSDSTIASRQLIHAAVELAARLRCPTLELRGGVMPSGGAFSEGRDGWHFDSTTYQGFVRPLAIDDNAELLAIPRKQRAEVRKGLAAGLVVETGRSAAQRAAHYQVYAESVRNLGTPVFPAKLFGAVMDEFGNNADILSVRHEGSAVASVLSLYFKGTVMPYWGGGTAAARTLRANDVMYFELMRHARARGCSHFDFGRSKTGTGAAAFKHNWGFDAVPLPYAKHAADGADVREINPLDPRYARKVQLWRKLPLWAANRIGPWIARGLG